MPNVSVEVKRETCQHIAGVERYEAEIIVRRGRHWVGIHVRPWGITRLGTTEKSEASLIIGFGGPWWRLFRPVPEKVQLAHELEQLLLAADPSVFDPCPRDADK